MNYNKTVSALLGLSTFCFISQANAQQSKTLSLTEAISMGVQHSKVLKQSEAQKAIAAASLQQLKDNRLPSASVSGSYLRVSKPTVALLLNTGSSSGSGSGSGNSGGGAPNVSEAMYAMGNASYTLFDGFKNSAKITASKYQVKAAESEMLQNKQQVSQNVIEAYTHFFKAGKAVELVKENLKQAKQRSEDFQNLEKNGLIARNDLLKVQLQESNIQMALMDAEKDLNITKLNLELLLGLPDSAAIIVDSNSFVDNNSVESLPYWEQKAIDSRADLQALGFRQKAASSSIKAARAGYYPSVSLSGGYLALNVPNALKVSDAWNGGIGVRYNIASLWKTPAEINLAKAQYQQIEASKELLADNIRIQLYQSFEAYKLSRKKIEVLQIALMQAKENYKIVKNKHTNSLATTTDLLDADVQQLQAELNCSYAKADAVVAYNKLLLAAGQMP